MTSDARAARAPGADRPLSLSYYTVSELDPVEAVAVAAECGFAFVGLRLLGGQPGGSETPLLAEAAVRRRVRSAMRDTGVRALDANTARLVPGTRVGDFAPMLEAAAELGARHVLTTCDDADRSRLEDNLSALAESAADRSLTVDIEFVPWQAASDLDIAAQLVRDTGHPALGIAVDALHFARSGSDVTTLRELPRRWFRYIQLCDAPAPGDPPSRDQLIHEATRERLAPGKGDLDLTALLDALPDSLPLALEVPQATLARALAARERVARLVRATRALLRRGAAAD